MTTEPMERRTLTVEEAGEVLGICRNTAYSLAASGQLPTIRLGRRLLVPRKALERMLDGTGPAPKPVGEPVGAAG